MREIKFRQPLKRGGFHYWGYIDGGFISPLTEFDASGRSQQYTSLKDKNGKEICEGDILEYTFDGVWWTTEVKALGGRFGNNLYDLLLNSNIKKDKITAIHELEESRNNPGQREMFIGGKNSKTIGNIHENPGLLSPAKPEHNEDTG